MTTLTVPARGEEAFIRLKNVPAHLALPAPEGSTYLLDVTVSGAPAKSVWLGWDAESHERLALSKVGEDEYQMNLFSRAVVELLQSRGLKSGEIHVFAEAGDGRVAASAAISYTIRLPARPLTLVDGRQSLHAYQRCVTEVPGGNLRVRLGDITAGAVPLAMTDSLDNTVLERATVRDGDVLPFVLAGAAYVLVVQELVNLPIGEDFARLSIWEAAAWRTADIERLLSIVAKSDAMFLRDGVESRGTEAAAHLRRKWEAASPAVRTAEEFLDHVATRSGTSGEPYRVKLPDGRIVVLADWLRGQTLSPAASAPVEHHPAPEP
ncbi:MAG: DUF5329 family protein [Planctomycetes bacterium]|nr:DUF5329 family protein [Planctomycetota bacterium]